VQPTESTVTTQVEGLYVADAQVAFLSYREIIDRLRPILIQPHTDQAVGEPLDREIPIMPNLQGLKCASIPA
jgi:hypothetical protein